MDENFTGQNMAGEDAEFQSMMQEFWGEDFEFSTGVENSKGQEGNTEQPPIEQPQLTQNNNMPQGNNEMPRSNHNMPPNNQNDVVWMQRIEAAQAKAVDDFIAKQYKGQVNPYNGQPIDSVAAYEEYRQMAATQQLQEQIAAAGLDKTVIDSLIAEHPAIKKAEQTAKQAEHLIEMQQSKDAQNFTVQSIQALQRMYPESNIKSLADLSETQEGRQALEYWRRGVPLEKAYQVAFGTQLQESQAKAARQQALNDVNSKGHLMQPQGQVGGNLTMSAEDKAIWREFYPHATDAELEAKWKKTQ